MGVVWATLITAAIAFLTALLGFFASRNNGKKINEVHVLVNSRLSNVMDRVDQLTGTLHDNAIAIPHDPAEPPTIARDVPNAL